MWNRYEPFVDISDATGAMKLVIFNLRHGSNLGDRLIAECMEAELESLGLSLSVRTEDLAGRDEPSTGAQRRLAFLVLDRLPRWLRLLVAEVMLNRLAKGRLWPKWRRAIADADAVMIGGGGIFADSDLNFPIKIATALQVAAERGLPVAVHAVGVTRVWSARGEAIFGRALGRSRLVRATARDAASIEFWARHTEGYSVKPAALAVDPALLAARHFSSSARPEGGRPKVGLGITSPDALRYHGGRKIEPEVLSRQFVDMAKALRAGGADVCVFTTGVPEDDQFMRQVALRLDESVSVVEPFSSAAEMASFVGSCSLVISHRLHAIICAYAFGVPSIALAWDEKMVGQCAVLGMSDRLFDLAATPISTIVDCAFKAIPAGVDPVAHRALIDSASRDLRLAAEALLVGAHAK